MPIDDTLLAAVAAIHDACFDAEAWTAALGLVASLLDSNGVVLALEDKRHGFATSYEAQTAPEARADYLGTFHAIDPVIAFVRQAPPGRSYPDWATIARPDLSRTRFHNEFSTRFDYGQCMQAFTHREAGCAGFLVAARSDRQDPFDAGERAIVDALIPHVERALRVRTLLNRAEVGRVTALAALDHLSQGVFLVDADLTVLHANPQAERLLRERDGLRAQGAKLTATSSTAAAQLRRHVGHVSQGGLIGDLSLMAVPRPPPRRPLFLRTVRLTPAMAERMPGAPSGACIFAHDPDRSLRAAGPELSDALGLTPAEARVATLLARGQALDAVAAALGVSITTVRTHLNHLFSKTGTGRQVELVNLIRAVSDG